jgi:hypothetical protein
MPSLTPAVQLRSSNDRMFLLPDQEIDWSLPIVTASSSHSGISIGRSMPHGDRSLPVTAVRPEQPETAREHSDTSLRFPNPIRRYQSLVADSRSLIAVHLKDS